MTKIRCVNRRHLASAGACLTVFCAGALGAEPFYTLVSQQAGIDALCIPSELYGQQHDEMCGGVSVGDFNNDSWPDLYIPGLGTAPDMLYINQQDGTFVDQAALWGIDRIHLGQGSAVGDVNNDGYLDLYVVSFGPADPDTGPQAGRCLLYINNGPDEHGQYSFSEQARLRGVHEVMPVPAGKGAALGDMDLDGDLDLFVATWQYTDEGGGNRIFENDGNGFFTDVTDTVLPTLDGTMRGFTPKFVDVTGDRYPDLLLSNDFSTSRLLVNNGPDAQGRVSFRDTTEISGITTDRNAMGATVNDFNGDGLLDWFQTNVFVSSAGYANTLFMGMGNDEHGNPIFEDQATDRGVEDVGWGWGTVSGDYDNDGDLDIVATGGWPNWPTQATRYWRNDGLGFFEDHAPGVGLGFTINGKGLVQLDYDKDGDLDLAFIDSGGAFRLYNNALSPANDARWLRVDLNTDAHPCLAPGGYGTRVIATYAGREHLRVVDGSSSYLGQSEMTLHFGLGPLGSVDRLRFEWGDGSVTTMTDIPADQQITVRALHRLDLTGDGRIDFFDVSALVRAYIASDARADFNDDGSIDVRDIIDFLASYTTPCP